MGLNYQRTIGALRFTVGAGYQTWLDWPDNDAGRPEGFVVGMELRHGEFQLGAAHIAIDDTFDGGGAETTDSQDGTGFRLGLGYAWGPNEASLTWHCGEGENDPANPAKAENETVLASLRRTIAPDVRLYGTLLLADFEGEAAAATDDNKGWALVSGLRLDF